MAVILVTKAPTGTFSGISAWYSNWVNLGLEKFDSEMAILATAVALSAGLPPSVTQTVSI